MRMFSTPYCKMVRPQGLLNETDSHPSLFFDPEASQGKTDGQTSHYVFVVISVSCSEACLAPVGYLSVC